MRDFFRYIFALGFLIMPLFTMSQTDNQLGFLPSLNVNKKLPKDWSLNFKAESRQSLFKDGFKYDYLSTDLSMIAATKISINTSVAVGYLIRIDGETVKNRSIQQMNIVKRHTGFRLSHRLAADQTFEKDEATEFRFRYRLSSEIPLAGQSLDPKEFFLKFGYEYLLSLYEKTYDLEVRGAGFIGYALSPNNKIELGMDYRYDSFLKGNTPRNRFWIGLNFYQAI